MTRIDSLLDDLRTDVRYAIRSLFRNKAFTVAAIATLALGIGANAAVFSVFNAVLIRELPVKNPEELVMFHWLRMPNPMVAAYWATAGRGRAARAFGRPSHSSPSSAFATTTPRSQACSRWRPCEI